MKKLAICLLILVASLSVSGIVFAEYIRATDEEEFIFVSTESEVNMGKSLAKNAVKQFGLDDDAALQKKIKDIGEKIALICDRKDITYHFDVLKGDELKPESKINAFAIPGGYIFIFRDMVKLMESDDEIAGVLAHEVGHIAAKHSIKRLQSSYGAMALSIIAGHMGEGRETKMRTGAALSLLMTSYSREHETLADKLSVRYLKKAGYDPEAILSSIDKMMERHRQAPLRTYTAYQTHPYLAERKSAVKKELYGRIDFVDFINEPAVLGQQ